MTDTYTASILGGPMQEYTKDQLTDEISAMLKGERKSRMKPDREFDQAAERAYNVTADELRHFIERFEQLEAEKSDVTQQQAEVMQEAKGRGYDTKVMRKIIALRKRKPDEIAEEEAIMEIYKAALGMK